jgi:phosphoribosylaminoimidazole-succinocarboxamide synthase
MRLIHSGKVKDVYEVDPDTFLFNFTDRVSAFDIPMITPIKGKGEILCKFAEFWFNTLTVENHMISKQESDKMLVKRLDMIPVEFVVRGYLYGTLYERYLRGEFKNLESLGDDPVLASKLPFPVFDPSTKSNIHDSPISSAQILEQQLLNSDDLSNIQDISLRLYKDMNGLAERAGFIIADVKFEFGRDPKSGKILLADSIGPDEFRIWSKSEYHPGRIQNSYDKQYLRDWLANIGFKEKVDLLKKQGRQPIPPHLPEDVVQQLLERYTFVYQKIASK